MVLVVLVDDIVYDLLTTVALLYHQNQRPHSSGLDPSGFSRADLDLNLGFEINLRTHQLLLLLLVDLSATRELTIMTVEVEGILGCVYHSTACNDCLSRN